MLADEERNERVPLYFMVKIKTGNRLSNLELGSIIYLAYYCHVVPWRALISVVTQAPAMWCEACLGWRLSHNTALQYYVMYTWHVVQNCHSNYHVLLYALTFIMDLQYIFVCAVVLLITYPELSKYLLDQEVWDNCLPPSLNSWLNIEWK